MDNQIVVNDYRQMDKILKEERQYLLNLCKRLKIMVIKDIERDEIDFISKSTGAKPVADIEAFTEDKLGSAELVEEASQSGAKVVKVTGVKNPGRTVSVVLTGANSLVLEESERSLHDALCVVRCLVKKRYVQAASGQAASAVWPQLLPSSTTELKTDMQGINRRRRSTRDPRFKTPNTTRTNSKRKRSILLPSIRRSIGSYPYYTC
jgi:chaperonin GroEL (HSP60 family)